MVKYRSCLSQWPYLIVGAMVGALAVYYRDHLQREKAVAATGWKGIDEREQARSQRDRWPLTMTHLRRIDLRYADLRDSDLTGADLEGANLCGANLQRSGLALTNFVAADLSDALINRAVLFGANLQRAILSDADLRSANLMLANLEAADISRAHMDERTILPNGEYWSQHADLCRFTDAHHPLFWYSPAFVLLVEPVRLSH